MFTVAEERLTDQLADTQAAGSSTKQSRDGLLTKKRGTLEHLHQTGPLCRLSSLTHLRLKSFRDVYQPENTVEALFTSRCSQVHTYRSFTHNAPLIKC